MSVSVSACLCVTTKRTNNEGNEQVSHGKEKRGNKRE